MLSNQLENYLTQLNSALEKGDLETIEELLKQDINLTIDLPLDNSNYNHNQ